ncbi:unnamed protein product [Cuscuta campestris]|uniref:VQ domain-containing protein n=2 Tax=Cuscuta sect. Cleistogrammica TaxID=1824901 RepID=A0A484K7I6_9ASTE|nr:hypothetical protein DM860_010507 [Cuscuta australis]VFQ59287.1 unnamed protein product [Cuscuta campestris]
MMMKKKMRISKDSHAISKSKPAKIRVIHIFAPEIIVTDAQNFRELVQRLTGKPPPPAPERTRRRVDSKRRTLVAGEEKMGWECPRDDSDVGSPEFDGLLDELKDDGYCRRPPQTLLLDAYNSGVLAAGY